MRKKSIAVALVLCLTMILSAMVGLTNRAKADTAAGSYRTGQIVEFGSYPQKRVQDYSLTQELKSAVKNKTFTNYPYTSKDETYDFEPGTTTWKNTATASGRTATYTLTTAASHQGYKFRCVVKDGNGAPMTSREATLTVKPKITTQPSSTSVTVGSKASFTVAATGSGTLTYQWQYLVPGTTTWKNTSLASGRTATYTFTTAASHNGYKFRCVVTDGNGQQSTSGEAKLTIQ